MSDRETETPEAKPAKARRPARTPEQRQADKARRERAQAKREAAQELEAASTTAQALGGIVSGLATAIEAVDAQLYPDAKEKLIQTLEGTCDAVQVCVKTIRDCSAVER
jgi:hypothetical protein